MGTYVEDSIPKIFCKIIQGFLIRVYNEYLVIKSKITTGYMIFP